MASRSRRARTIRAFVITSLVAAPLHAQATQRLAVRTDGTPAVIPSTYPSISADGRYVAFQSGDPSLVPGDLNQKHDIFVRDRLTGTTERVSVKSSGVEANNDSFFCAISANARYVAFDSFASNLVAHSQDINNTQDVFVHDRVLGTTELVSISMSGEAANGTSEAPEISADGRYIAFDSDATDLTPGETNLTQVFVRDRQTGTTRNATWIGHLGPVMSSYVGGLSADGRYLAFATSTGFLVAGDTNHASDAFVRDLLIGGIERMSVSSAGIQGDGNSGGASISADARYVAFASEATNLVDGDGNAAPDVFVHDRTSGTTVCASVSPAGRTGNGPSSFASISSDGRYVAFLSAATNLVDGVADGRNHVYLRNLEHGTTELVDTGFAGGPANAVAEDPVVSGHGEVVAYVSGATDLLPGGTSFNAYARDRRWEPYASDACDPTSGFLSCPCGNPPSRPGRGCDNSAGTGGARLVASGGNFISSDSVVFTASGLRPGATCLLLQGTRITWPGSVYGQGLRCIGGEVRRLFTKEASGSSLTVPEFAAGDPTITQRSAAKGSPIGPEQRTYLVVYRDPTVLGGCPATSTFNATQTVEFVWYR